MRVIIFRIVQMGKACAVGLCFIQSSRGGLWMQPAFVKRGAIQLANGFWGAGSSQ